MSSSSDCPPIADGSTPSNAIVIDSDEEDVRPPGEKRCASPSLPSNRRHRRRVSSTASPIPSSQQAAAAASAPFSQPAAAAAPAAISPTACSEEAWWESNERYTGGFRCPSTHITDKEVATPHHLFTDHGNPDKDRTPLEEAIDFRIWTVKPTPNPELSKQEQEEADEKLFDDVNDITATPHLHTFPDGTILHIPSDCYDHIMSLLGSYPGLPGAPFHSPRIKDVNNYNKSILTFAFSNSNDYIDGYVNFLRGRAAIRHINLFAKYMAPKMTGLTGRWFTNRVKILGSPMQNFKKHDFVTLPLRFHHTVAIFYAMLVFYCSQTEVSLHLDVINHIMTFLTPFDCFAVLD